MLISPNLLYVNLANFTEMREEGETRTIKETRDDPVTKFSFYVAFLSPKQEKEKLAFLADSINMLADRI